MTGFPKTYTGAPSQRSGSAPARNRRILLIEDFADARETISELLEMMGYRVTSAACCADARAVTAAPDLIVSDIGLPDGTGFELLRHLRSRPDWERVPAVAVSGFNEPEHFAQAEAAGFLRYLVKPVSILELDQVILSLIAARA